jgi:pimeloyl-ACP methyl ester carboxylesterase
MNHPPRNSDTLIILLPGMAADERLFRLQRTEFPGLITPTWIEPNRREPLRDYARRLGQCIDPGEPCFVGGASFGGTVALEMAVHLRAEACFLIASVRSRDGLPWQYRALRPVAQFGPERLGRIAGWCSRWLAPFLPTVTNGLLNRLAQPRSDFLRWASWAILNWKPSPQAVRLMVYQIHGSADRTLPIRYARPDHIVAGGGHLLPLSHGAEVNDFLRRRIEQHRRLARGSGDRPDVRSGILE